MAELDTATPIAPYGATVNGVTALVPEVKLWTSDQPLPEGTYRITATQVAEWVAELSDTISMELDGWDRLSQDPTLAEDGTTVLIVSDLERFVDAARTIVHNGAASYLEAARHPERARNADTSYAAVLWQRYTDGLTRLTAWLTKRLAEPESGDTPEPEAAIGGAWSFPCPTFADGFPV